MNDTEVLEFRQGVALPLIILAILALIAAFSRLLSGHPGELILHLPLAAFCFFAAGRSRRPYACFSENHIVVNLTAVQSTQVIPWSCVKEAVKLGPNTTRLVLSDGKCVIINARIVRRTQRDLFLATLNRYLDRARVPLG